MQNFLNSIGLCLDIIGAVLLFMYGLPKSLSRQGHIYLIAEQVDEAEAEQARKYDRYSQGALILLIAGFVFQLVSNFV